MAPLAKLAMTDIGSGSGGTLGGISGVDLNSGYYPWPYVRCACVRTITAHVKDSLFTRTHQTQSDRRACSSSVFHLRVFELKG